MNTEEMSAIILCKGKVSSSKERLLRRLSTNQSSITLESEHLLNKAFMKRNVDRQMISPSSKILYGHSAPRQKKTLFSDGDLCAYSPSSEVEGSPVFCFDDIIDFGDKRKEEIDVEEKMMGKVFQLKAKFQTRGDIESQMNSPLHHHPFVLDTSKGSSITKDLRGRQGHPSTPSTILTQKVIQKREIKNNCGSPKSNKDYKGFSGLNEKKKVEDRPQSLCANINENSNSEGRNSHLTIADRIKLLNKSVASKHNISRADSTPQSTKTRINGQIPGTDSGNKASTPIYTYGYLSSFPKLNCTEIIRAKNDKVDNVRQSYKFDKVNCDTVLLPHDKVKDSVQNIDQDQNRVNERCISLKKSHNISSIKQNEDRWKQRPQKSTEDQNNIYKGNINEIHKKLLSNQSNWVKRIEQKDVRQFSNEGRLQAVHGSFLTKHQSFYNSSFRENSTGNTIVVRLKKSDTLCKYPTKMTLTSTFVPTSEGQPIVKDLQAKENKPTLVSNCQQQVVRKVPIPQISDHSLSRFFESPESNQGDVLINEPEHTSDDFDNIFINTDLNLNIPKRSIKPMRKTKTSHKNPIKRLNERLDLVDEYEEKIMEVSESNSSYGHLDNIQSQKPVFTKEALAALSTKEDFSKVKLKSTESDQTSEHFFSPYKDVMLISIKGRKKVQVRLVEPIASSMNCGDCYLLVTGSQLFLWQGVAANVIETNKANELGCWIAKHKDLNYKGKAARPVIVKSTDSVTNSNVIQFWSSLKYDKVQSCGGPGPLDEDDIYEQRIQSTNIVYKVVDNLLIPFEEYWGQPLKYKMLDENQVFIFDFGSELYLWTGKNASNNARMHGKTLLRQLWDKGYNYESCSINPIYPLTESVDKRNSKRGMWRPDWVIVGRLIQKGETILLKEKFVDWPESSRLIRMGGSVSSLHDSKSSSVDLKPVDLDEVMMIGSPCVDLTIDGKNVGRGGKRKVVEDGILREFDVITKKVEAWHIMDNEAVQVEESGMGQFFNADTYIIRWDFEIKTLGRFQRNQSSGNVSSVFFFWQGVHASVTEKTASALHTIGLDKDKVSQIRVKQHDERPAFCRLFAGAMIILHGKQKYSRENMSAARLFIIRGERKEESHFVEVKCHCDSLRTRSAFLLINNDTCRSHLWLGKLCPEEAKSCAYFCIKSLAERNPSQLCVPSHLYSDIRENQEGCEAKLFWEDFGFDKGSSSVTSLSKLEPIRGWLVSSVTNSFCLKEIEYSLKPEPTEKYIPSFPIIQSTLYKASQPALYIIWTMSHVYLWQGWWPDMVVSISSDSEDDEGDHDWSIPKNRIAADKLATLKSLHLYLEKHKSERVSASIIYAGLEPLSFRALFPFWEVNESSRIANMKKGYRMFQQDDVAQTLDMYLSQKFSFSQLKRKPRPECVILSKIEWYLCDEEFEALFKMTKSKFYEMSSWKQTKKKQDVGLF